MSHPPSAEAQAVVDALASLEIKAHATGDCVTPEVTGEPLKVVGGHPVEGRDQIVVSDRISADVRLRYRQMGLGWLALSGHLYLRQQGLVVDAEVPGSARVTETSMRLLGGPVVSGVAIGALARWPKSLGGVRQTARELNATPGGVSLAMRRLVDAGYLTSDHRAMPTLFWALSAEWRPRWVDLPAMPEFGHEGAFGSGAVMVGALAAERLGAPIVVTAATKPEILVISAAALSMLEMRAETSSPVEGDLRFGGTGIRCAVAPSAAVLVGASEVDSAPVRLASEAVVALTLAVDPGRGAETVREWKGDHVW